MAIQRTKKTDQKYKKFIAQGFLENGCGLCKKNKNELIKEFKYWKIVKNRFPWDRIAKTSHMVIPKRHVSGEKLTKIEKRELEIIKFKYIEKEYELLAEATTRKKSIPGHFHVHLLILKKEFR